MNSVTATISPLSQKAAAPAQRLSETHSPWRALIVDDHALVRQMIRIILESYSDIIEVVGEASDGEESISLAKVHRPDLVLMDIQLPEVSGLEVTKWIKEDDDLKSIPVVAVTAFAMKGDEERIREGGCEAYISKPISVSMFLATVRQFIGEAR